MKREIFKEIEIPSGVEAEITGDTLRVKGLEGEISRKLGLKKVEIEKKEGKIIIGTKTATKNEKKMINSTVAHVNNMVNGVQEKFEYKLKVCFSHFPISVDIKGKEVIIKNFLGEKVPRKMAIPSGVEVDLNKDIITIKSVDRELAGQTAANFETATRITNRDRRVFQDGIFLVNKPGRDI